MRKNAGIAVLFLVSMVALPERAAAIAAPCPRRKEEAAQLDAAGRCDEAEVFYRAALAQRSSSAALLK